MSIAVSKRIHPFLRSALELYFRLYSILLQMERKELIKYKNKFCIELKHE